MNITQFIKYLNKEKGWELQGQYYAIIDEWRQWWRGNYAPFHCIKESGLDGNIHTRDMYRLRMPKRACEDWASLLLNDKTTVTVDDKQSAEWLLGDNAQQTGGELGRLDFWHNANTLVELAFRSGTGAFVLGVENLAVIGGIAQNSKEARICMDYLPAECILPLTIRHGKIIDTAFASEVIVGGKSCIYLQTHKLTMKNGVQQYTITNEYFTSESEDSENAEYKPAPLPAGMVKSFSTGSDVPWFSIFSPNIVKNIPLGPGLGMSVFSEALDQAKHCDLAFDNYCRDIYLGGKKVFYNKNLLKSIIDGDGNVHYLPPDDIRQQLFVHAPGSDPEAEPAWHEYNPDLRTEANSQAVQDALDYFSFKVGLGTHHYQFNAGNIATATQYTGDRQDMVQHANRHQIKIEAALLQILRAMLWVGKVLTGAPIDENAAVTINFDDSYISDAETRRQRDKDDAMDGFIPKYRYNMEWRGMSEDDAKRAVQEAASETADYEPMGFGGDA